MTPIGDRWKFVAYELCADALLQADHPAATGHRAFNNESEVIRHSLRLTDSLERAAGPLSGSFAEREDFEELLLEGLVSGASAPMMGARKKRIYKEALEEA